PTATLLAYPTLFRSRPAKRWCASYAPESATPTSSSPRQRPSVAEEPSGRPVVRQRRRPHDARRAFGDGPSTRAAHVGGHPTGARSEEHTSELQSPAH